MKALVAVAITLFAFTASGCKKAESTEPAPTVQPAAFAVGDKVDVKWNGSWWKAEILAVNTPKYRVHYTGWSASWDEDVTSDRVRTATAGASQGTETTAATATATAPAASSAAPVAAPTPAPASAAVAAWKVGDKVDVQWNGAWWAGQILSVNGAQYKVHYIGWASSWDETVTTARLRASTPGAKRGSGPT